MGYTGTIPYTAQDFVPGQKALAQDITNISYALARLDQNAANAYCVKLKDLGAEDQTFGKSGGTNPNSGPITFSTISADPLGMSTAPDTITIPFDGIWTLSCFMNCPENTISTCGGWFVLNGVGGNDNDLGTNSTAGNNTTIGITMPFSAGDTLQAYFLNKDTTQTARVQRGVFSCSLVH